MRLKPCLGFILFICIVSLNHVVRADSPFVSISGNRISIHAEKTPLQDILKQMVAFGIRVRIDPGLNPKITAFFENRDIQKGIGSILRPLNYVLIWKTMAGAPVSVDRLTEIQIFRTGEKQRMQFLARPGFVVQKDPRDGSLYVKDEILLRLGQGVSYAEFMQLLKKFGGIVVDVDPVPGIYRIRLPEGSDVPALVSRIRKQRGVSGAEPNYAYPVMRPYRGESITGVDEIRTQHAVQPAGAPIAILDTGFRSDAGTEGIVVASLDALNPERTITDDLGHGTQMVLIASGLVRPFGVREISGNKGPVIPIRIFDDNGVTSNFTIMRSVDFALRNGARVMSLSWGTDTRSGFLERALEHARSKGLYIVASAGNEPTGKPVYPAAYPGIIGVGALSPDGRPWEKSNYGDFVMIRAPGFAALPVGYHGDPGIYAGTSISAAFVAGAVSDYVSRHPGATLEDVCVALRNRF